MVNYHIDRRGVRWGEGMCWTSSQTWTLQSNNTRWDILDKTSHSWGQSTLSQCLLLQDKDSASRVRQTWNRVKSDQPPDRLVSWTSRSSVISHKRHSLIPYRQATPGRVPSQTSFFLFQWHAVRFFGGNGSFFTSGHMKLNHHMVRIMSQWSGVCSHSFHIASFSSSSRITVPSFGRPRLEGGVDRRARLCETLGACDVMLCKWHHMSS